MFKYLLCLLGVSILTIQSGGQEQSMVKITPKDYGDVSGTVFDKVTNKPAASVSVWIYDKYGDIITLSKTDIDGRYSMEYQPLQVGTYYFCIPSNEWGTNGNYLKQFYKSAGGWRNASLVNVEKDKKLSTVDFYLETGSTLSGNIKCGGKPVYDSIVISVYDAYKIYSYSSHSTHTDSSGNYKISGIKSGNSKVYISLRNYIGTYYGQVQDWEDATMINIAPNDTTKNIDISVKKGGKISGNVYSEKTKLPVSNVTIYCESESFNTDSSGYFEFCGLDSGEYTLRTRAGYNTGSPYADQFYKCAAGYTDADLISVATGQNIKGIKMYLKEGGRIPISVVDENGTPVTEGATICIINEGETGNNRSCWGVGGSNFEYPNIFPGKYTVYISYFGERSSGISYGATYYKNANRLENATFIEVKGGYKTSPVTVKMQQGGWIQGFVKYNEVAIDGDSSLCTIIAYDSKSGSVAGYGTSTFCGGYEVKSLPVGEYKLEVLCNDYPSQYYGGGETFDDTRTKTIEVKKGKPEFDVNFDMVNANCSISGNVSVGKKETPLLPVTVSVYDKTGHIVKSAYVKKGKYELKNLRPGEYTIRTVSTKGYTDKWHNNVELAKSDNFDNKHYFVETPKNVEWLSLKEGQKVKDINFSLKRKRI
ncbi:MAG: hypothetical protein WC614_08965 [bacterium]